MAFGTVGKAYLLNFEVIHTVLSFWTRVEPQGLLEMKQISAIITCNVFQPAAFYFYIRIQCSILVVSRSNEGVRLKC